MVGPLTQLFPIMKFLSTFQVVGDWKSQFCVQMICKYQLTTWKISNYSFCEDLNSWRIAGSSNLRIDLVFRGWWRNWLIFGMKNMDIYDFFLF